MKRFGLAIGVVLVLGGVVLAGDDGRLHGAIDFTYQSKFVWRGFDLYGDKSAMQPSIDLDLYGTGFGISAMGHRANSSGSENMERWDYTLYYYNAICPGEKHQVNYRVNWVYYNMPDHSSDTFDLQEIWTGFFMPNLLGVKGLVPGYILAKAWPSSSNSMVGSRSPFGGSASGWAHIFMLDYACPVCSLLPDKPEQVLRLHADVTYNDGVGPGGQNIDQDWSHAVFGVAMDFDMDNGFVITPGLYHQVTMEKSVNPDKDETWVTLSATYKF
ncbi:MAG: hypothetical protein ACYS8Z_10310 [Planctomycetota bacterium]